MDAATDLRLVGGVGVPEALLSDPERFGGVRQGDLRCGTLILRGGRVEGLTLETGNSRPECIVLSRLAEAHVHLDKCHSIERCNDVGGNLQTAIAAQMRDKVLCTAEDLERRARRGLSELVAAGCSAVRTHVDWSASADAPLVPLAWEVFGALNDEAVKDGVTLQRAALTDIDEMSDPARADAVARRVARDGGVLGSLVLHHIKRREGLEVLFACAEHYGLSLDFHVDEGLDPDLNGLELIADVAGAMRFSGPVLCGHACSLASRSDDDVARIADKLARAGVAVAALPSTNLYLQGRRDGTPDRRGITRLRELARRGVDIIVGTDNVRDAFCPIGRHDPIHSLGLAVLAGHLDPPFGRHLHTITSTARRAMGLEPLNIEGAAVADLLVCPVPSLSDLISGNSPVLPLTEHLGVTNAP
ncbi:MAG: amidohydrolase family protein [Limimaricola sp.]|uniref:amidohydrolase family protein n=1 Tax=Limimaricola sp. TaxID=2211665 RepID=UPI001DE05C79|nr:amidohydrolase family protein [Limimaricola sp.]MBI1416806.1 amidohydrolase family protein [Limimaricola sp.]